MTTLRDELDAFIESDEPLGTFDDAGEFVPAPIANADEASRGLRRLARLGRQKADIEELRRAEIARINGWADDRVSGIDRQVQWSEMGLEGFMRQAFMETGRKTVDLPNGELKLRAARSRIEITDPEAFEEWARTHERDDLVRFSVVPDKAALARLPVDIAFTAPGATDTTAFVMDGDSTIPGVVVVTPIAESFSYKANTKTE